MAEMGFQVSSVNRQNHTIQMIVNGAAVTAVCAPQNNPEVYHQVKSMLINTIVNPITTKAANTRSFAR